MFRTYKSQSSAGFALNISLQIFHATVRSIRKKHRSPIVGLMSEMMQSAMLVGVFLIFFPSSWAEGFRASRRFCDLYHEWNFPFHDPQ